MNKIPFEYGSIAENEYFIDRIEDRKDLKTFLGGGINVMLISPRRWGKSSLVKAAMEELKQEQKDVKVCYLDNKAPCHPSIPWISLQTTSKN